MMNPIYNTSIALLRGVVNLTKGFNVKAAKMLDGQKATFATLEKALEGNDSPVMWIHAASLGEFEQGRPLIEMLKSEHPEWKVVLSFFSPSGYEVRKNFPLADVVVYLPFDTPSNARRFIDIVNPTIAVFVKYEFWGNYLSVLKSKEIPTYIISAIFRPSQAFFKPWGGSFRKMLQCFTHLYVQDEASRKLLDGIGVSNVTVAGDTRFDRVADVRSTKCSIEWIPRMMDQASMRFIAGSSWPADEVVYADWLNARKDVKFIIAPHEFNQARLSHLKSLFPGRNVMLLSEWQRAGSPAETEGLIVDSFGHLSSLYRYGDVAYIGGGFGTGIHNINEAAVYGIPVVFGPRHHKFREAAGLIECGGGVSVRCVKDFDDVMDHFLSEPATMKKAGQAAGRYISDNLGATRRIYDSIFGKKADKKHRNYDKKI